MFVSGIGCSGRFSYYMDTYGMHGIHGRAPALATGIATAHPDLSVWVVTGDGDGLSIGGNHLIHALRRNVPSRSCCSTTRSTGSRRASTRRPARTARSRSRRRSARSDHPFNPIALALGAEATFVARTLDNDRQHLTESCAQAAAHQGTAFVEIYQNCNVFNDGAFDVLREKPQGVHNQIRLVHGEPILFGAEGERGVVRGADGGLELVDVADVGEDALLVHDAHREDPSLAFALAHLADGPTEPTPIGVFRDVERPLHGASCRGARRRPRGRRRGQLDALLHSGDTWTVA